jgi:hypothetical protein
MPESMANEDKMLETEPKMQQVEADRNEKMAL